MNGLNPKLIRLENGLPCGLRRIKIISRARANAFLEQYSGRVFFRCWCCCCVKYILFIPIGLHNVKKTNWSALTSIKKGIKHRNWFINNNKALSFFHCIEFFFHSMYFYRIIFYEFKSFTIIRGELILFRRVKSYCHSFEFYQLFIHIVGTKNTHKKWNVSKIV